MNMIKFQFVNNRNGSASLLPPLEKYKQISWFLLLMFHYLTKINKNMLNACYKNFDYQVGLVTCLYSEMYSELNRKLRHLRHNLATIATT